LPSSPSEKPSRFSCARGKGGRREQNSLNRCVCGNGLKKGARLPEEAGVKRKGKRGKIGALEKACLSALDPERTAKQQNEAFPCLRERADGPGAVPVESLARRGKGKNVPSDNTPALLLKGRRTLGTDLSERGTVEKPEILAKTETLKPRKKKKRKRSRRDRKTVPPTQRRERKTPTETMVQQ